MVVSTSQGFGSSWGSRTERLPQRVLHRWGIAPGSRRTGGEEGRTLARTGAEDLGAAEIAGETLRMGLQLATHRSLDLRRGAFSPAPTPVSPNSL